MSSTRLPGKVLQDIAGQPMVWHVIQRARQTHLVDQVVVATTTDISDGVLDQYCQGLGVPCYRGSSMDVLDRFYQAACQFSADAIIRLTADCPLLDPQVLDLTMLTFLGQPTPIDMAAKAQITNASSLRDLPLDFCTNRLPPPWQRTVPIGLDVEICSFSALERAWHEALEPYQREHVMPFLYEGLAFDPDSRAAESEWSSTHSTTPRGFRVAVLNHYPDYGSLRWTVDTQEDLSFVRQVYDRFKGQEIFDWHDVLALLEKEPQLASINAGVKHKSVFDIDHRGITK